jgi:hypothetical protein
MVPGPRSSDVSIRRFPPRHTGPVTLAVFVLMGAIGVASQSAGQPIGLPLTGEAAEAFLQSATIVEIEEFDSRGITKPRKIKLSDGDRTLYAVFKDVDVVHSRKKLNTGKTIHQLKDSYRHEIAAYELAKLLGLGLVPPSVEREVGGVTGALTLWVYDAMTEWHRRKLYRTEPPDPSRWERQMATVDLINKLTNDVDSTNTLNILIDSGWRVYKIDFSRAFHPKFRLKLELERYPKEPLDALRGLRRDELSAAVKPWLGDDELEALWVRRGEVLAEADELIAKHGEREVLFD